MTPKHPVLFVGAGPGAADLLTLRALRAIESAEVLLHDSLVNQEVITLAPPTCRLVDVGKRGDGDAYPQGSTNALLAQYARAGHRVVRLKGGDPSLFGRVEEERRYLEERGVETITIPGVTAASAAAAQFSFSLTERDVSRRVLYLTGRAGGGAVCLPSAALLADAQTTLVLYMAAHVIGDIEAAVLRAGRDPRTPVLMIESAGAEEGRAWRGALAGLTDLVAQARARGPSLIVIGDVAAHARGVEDVAALVRQSAA
jgi:uroporphyrin-III C-methyltransferase